MGAEPTSPDMERLFRVANGLMALLFGYSMGVQVNDPDGANWMAAYGIAAVLCVTAVLGRPRWKLSALLCALSAAAVVVVAQGVPTDQGLFDSGEGRELMGMALVSGWLAILTWWWRHHPEV